MLGTLFGQLPFPDLPDFRIHSRTRPLKAQLLEDMCSPSHCRRVFDMCQVQFLAWEHAGLKSCTAPLPAGTSQMQACMSMGEPARGRANVHRARTSPHAPLHACTRQCRCAQDLCIPALGLCTHPLSMSTPARDT